MKKYNGYIDSVKTEFGERVFSSRKRVIKFIAICFVPFLYGFICIWAFWNPIPKIGSAPMAIVSTDVPINFIAGKTPNKKFAFGEAIAYKDGENIVKIDDDVNVDDLPNNTEIITHAGTVIVKDTTTISNKTSLIDNFVDSLKENAVDNISYDENSDKFTVNVDESITLTNLKYLNGQAAQEIATQKSDGTWDVKNDSKYWVQIQIPKKLTSNIVSFLDASLQKVFHLDNEADYVKSAKYFLDDFKKFSMQFWSTYKNNFIFGQFMYILDKFKNSLIIDMGPQIISSLISLLLQNSIQDITGQLVFEPKQSINTTLTVKDHGSSKSHDVKLSLDAGNKYVIRNQEMIDAIEKKAYPGLKLPRLSIEGTTRTSINEDWKNDGFLNIFADKWNNLTKGKESEFILNRLAKSLTKKINNALGDGDYLEMTSEGAKKIFSTSGNIAGLLELDGSLIPETSANFNLIAKGSIESKIKTYKDLIIHGKYTLSSKFNLINILSAESKATESAYVLPFGSLIKPKIGTFNYNLHRDISAIINMLIFDKENSKSLESLDSGFLNILWPNLNDVIKTTIVGSQFNPYGIGLGQFFLCIGLWVGTLMQTFIYDRAKRVKNAKPWAWYLSKTTLMLITTWIQTTILMVTVYFLGWSVIGSSFGLIYLWMMFTGSVFVVIQQALWFSFQDETIGKFLVILLLIISLSSGWGTFPTFMQASIFNFLSYFTPYTYSIHGQGAIIYSIAIKGINLTDTLFILQQFGILLIWIILFLALGFFVSVARNRDMLYGTHNSKKLSLVLSEAKYKKYFNKKTKKVIWKNLPQEEMVDVIEKIKKRFPEENQYKWYKKLRTKKHLDKPLTASDSDDEIIKRNK